MLSLLYHLSFILLLRNVAAPLTIPSSAFNSWGDAALLRSVRLLFRVFDM